MVNRNEGEKPLIVTVGNKQMTWDEYVSTPVTEEELARRREVGRRIDEIAETLRPFSEALHRQGKSSVDLIREGRQELEDRANRALGLREVRMPLRRGRRG